HPREPDRGDDAGRRPPGGGGQRRRRDAHGGDPRRMRARLLDLLLPCAAARRGPGAHDRDGPPQARDGRGTLGGACPAPSVRATMPPMDINRKAPVSAKRDVLVHAPRERVWDVLTDFARWPEWNPDVREVRVDGPLAPGSVFRWKAGPSQIRSRLEEVLPPERITWTGSTMGIRAVHVHVLASEGDGTRVVSEESWSGLLARLFAGRMRSTLGDSLESGLAALKARSEAGGTAG